MIDAPWENIVLSELWPSGQHPARLRGKFRGRELCAVEAPDLQVSWEIAPGQDCEDFSRGVADAILEMRGLPRRERSSAAAASGRIAPPHARRHASVTRSAKIKLKRPHRIRRLLLHGQRHRRAQAPRRQYHGSRRNTPSKSTPRI